MSVELNDEHDTQGDLVMPISATKLRSNAGDCVVFGDTKKGVMTRARRGRRRHIVGRAALAGWGRRPGW